MHKRHCKIRTAGISFASAASAIAQCFQEDSLDMLSLTNATLKLTKKKEKEKKGYQATS
jgi:hypothetical protein